MSDIEVRITLRLPESLRDRLTKASELNNRSMNGEIVDRLDYTFDRVDAEMIEFRQKGVEVVEAELQIRREELGRARGENDQLRTRIGDLEERTSEVSARAADLQAQNRRLEVQLEEARKTLDYFAHERQRDEEMISRSIEWKRSSKQLTVLTDVTDATDPWAKTLKAVGEIADAVENKPYRIEAVMFDLTAIEDIKRSEHKEYILGLMLAQADGKAKNVQG